jgi:hypothetical protein
MSCQALPSTARARRLEVHFWSHVAFCEVAKYICQALWGGETRLEQLRRGALEASEERWAESWERCALPLFQ